jgi:hypothetical protein
MSRFPWHRLTELILFGMIFILIIIVSLLGHWDLVNTLSAAFVGAVTMFIKGSSGNDGSGNGTINPEVKQ